MLITFQKLNDNVKLFIQFFDNLLESVLKTVDDEKGNSNLSISFNFQIFLNTNDHAFFLNFCNSDVYFLYYQLMQ